MILTPEEIIKIRAAMEPERFIRLIKDLGFVRIGAGAFRDVYRQPKGKIVIKFGDSDENRDEHVNSFKFPSKYVATVLASSDDVLIQKYVKGTMCGRKCCEPPKCLSVLDDWHQYNHVHVGKNKRPVVFDLGGEI
jgi:hypothetical protein